MRIAIDGCSGAGKTTLAKRVSGSLDLPFTEIDGLHHGAGWVRRPTFAADVRALVDSESWVIEYGYAPVRPAILDRAELMVWLDLPPKGSAIFAGESWSANQARPPPASEIWAARAGVMPPLKRRA